MLISTVGTTVTKYLSKRKMNKTIPFCFSSSSSFMAISSAGWRGDDLVRAKNEGLWEIEHSGEKRGKDDQL